MSEISKQDVETLMLKETIEGQLNRLLDQLEDLEELKEELGDEYEEEKEETLAQLREFQAYLEQTLSGNMTLADEFRAAQQAIQAAVSQAFKTPEVIRLFAHKDSDELRKRLATLDRELKLRNINQDMYNRLASEVLVALKKMGEQLSVQETELLAKMSSNRHLEDALDGSVGSSVMSSAIAGIRNASK